MILIFLPLRHRHHPYRILMEKPPTETFTAQTKDIANAVPTEGTAECIPVPPSSPCPAPHACLRPQVRGKIPAAVRGLCTASRTLRNRGKKRPTSFASNVFHRLLACLLHPALNDSLPGHKRKSFPGGSEATFIIVSFYLVGTGRGRRQGTYNIQEGSS